MVGRRLDACRDAAMCRAPLAGDDPSPCGDPATCRDPLAGDDPLPCGDLLACRGLSRMMTLPHSAARTDPQVG